MAGGKFGWGIKNIKKGAPQTVCLESLFSTLLRRQIILL